MTAEPPSELAFEEGAIAKLERDPIRSQRPWQRPLSMKLISMGLACVLLPAFLHASPAASQAPAGPVTTLQAAKEAWDSTVSSTYRSVIDALKKQEDEARADLANAKGDVARDVKRNLLDRIRQGHDALVGSGEWPQVLSGKSDFNDALQSARHRVDDAYEAAIKLAIVTDDAPKKELLSKGRAAFAAEKRLSPWWEIDSVVKCVHLGTAKEEWTLSGKAIQAPQAPKAQSGYAPLTFESLPPAFLLKTTVSRVEGNGNVYVKLSRGTGAAQKVTLTPAMLERVPRALARDPLHPGAHLRVLYTDRVAAIELEGEEVWFEERSAGGDSATEGLEEVLIGSDDPRTKLVVDTFPGLRAFPLAQPMGETIQPATPAAAPTGQCVGAVVPTAGCTSLAAPVIAAIAAYEDKVDDIASSLLSELDQVMASSLNLSIQQLESLKTHVREQRERFRFRADVPPLVSFDIRNPLEKKYLQEREKVLAAFDAAAKSAETAGDAQCAADLMDARADFSSTQHLAPLWKHEEIQELVLEGKDLRSWKHFGTSWGSPASLNTDGTRTPFVLTGELPSEFALDLHLSLSAEARAGLHLSMSRNQIENWDVPITQEQLGAAGADGDAAKRTTTTVRVILRGSRLVVEVDRQRVWCQLVAEDPTVDKSDATHPVFRLSLVGENAGAKFNVDAADLRAVRSTGRGAVDASRSTPAEPDERSPREPR